MTLYMNAPDLEAGLNALRKMGAAGTPRREVEAMAESTLDAEWVASGLAAADLDDTARQWWGMGAGEAMLAVYAEGLRECARDAIRQRILDVPDSGMECLIEAAARAADLQPEDIVALVAEFCPIRSEGFALVFARTELATWHAPMSVHRKFLERHDRRKGGFPPGWYRALLAESRGFFRVAA